MDINSIMASQVAQLQQTLSMTLLDETLSQGAGVVEMLEEMPVQQAAHPFKGQVIDIQV